MSVGCRLLDVVDDRDVLIAHIAPLKREHITFNGDYVWPTEPLQNAFRPLRNPRSVWLTRLQARC
jgi:hypothetical protein